MNSHAGRGLAGADDFTTAEQDLIDSRSEDSSRSIPASTRLINGGSLPAGRRALTYNARGCGYVRSGQLDAAILDFGAAIALEPNNTIFYVNRGGAHLEKGDMQGAIDDLSFANAMRPNDATCCKLLGKFHFKQNRHLEAVEFLNRAVEEPHWEFRTNGTGFGSGIS